MFAQLIQLSEVGSRKTLWAERFNRDIEDILDVQEEIATVAVNTLVGQVSLRHYRRVQMSDANSVSAYEHALKAQQHIWTFSRESAALARNQPFDHRQDAVDFLCVGNRLGAGARDGCDRHHPAGDRQHR